jgi:starvation-inducible DNA-binding protein
MDDLKKAAQVGFASEFSFYLKAHNFHWNVEGADFLEFHDLFGKIYEEVYGSIDDFAEKIRALDAYVPASYTAFSMISQIADENAVPNKDAMLAELLMDNEKMIKVLKLVYDLAENYKEVGFSNFLAERIDAHRKHGWMLRSSLK